MSDIYGTDSLFLPLPWLTWLANNEVRLMLYSWRELYGVIRALHLLGLGGFYGASVLLALRAFGWAPSIPRGDTCVPRRIMYLSFALTVLTGILLFLRDPIGVGLHSMFLPKLLLVVLGFALANAMRLIQALPARRLNAAALLVIWTATVACSTWNHVERPVAIGAMLRATTSVPR